MEPARTLEHATFDEVKMSKVTLARGAGMMVGLNCFRPGQVHAVHSHPGQDKLYHVLAGAGAFQVDEREHELSAGDTLFVPGGVPHGAQNSGDSDLVVLVVLAPPPAPR